MVFLFIGKDSLPHLQNICTTLTFFLVPFLFLFFYYLMVDIKNIYTTLIFVQQNICTILTFFLIIKSCFVFQFLISAIMSDLSVQKFSIDVFLY